MNQFQNESYPRGVASNPEQAHNAFPRQKENIKVYVNHGDIKVRACCVRQKLGLNLLFNE